MTRIKTEEEVNGIANEIAENGLLGEFLRMDNRVSFRSADPANWVRVAERLMCRLVNASRFAREASANEAVLVRSLHSASCVPFIRIWVIRDRTGHALIYFDSLESCINCLTERGMEIRSMPDIASGKLGCARFPGEKSWFRNSLRIDWVDVEKHEGVKNA